MNYLLVDIGSTYTKLNLVDLKNRMLLGSAKAYTTVEKDVGIGYQKALEALMEQNNFTIDRTLGCSSAAGGLAISVIGFSRNLTTEAARLASLSSGARILKVYSYELNDTDLKELSSNPGDMVILCGGTEGGNEENIIYNATKIAQYGLQVPVVVAGNSKANGRIREIFEHGGVYHQFTENVMPATNVVNYKPLRETIGRIFIENIAKAKGIDSLSRHFDIFLPTPIAVQRAVSNFSKQIGEEVMSIDIGGATTDVMSIATAYKGEEHILPPSLDEPYEKRSVEGDMGMRYSAMAMYESVGKEMFQQWKGQDILENINHRWQNPDFIPVTSRDFAFDNMMAKIAAKTSLQRHIGYVKKRFTGTRYIYEQQGKDLRHVHYLLGTGGVLIHSKNPLEILQEIETLDNSYLAPEEIQYYIDDQYILSSAGLLATVDAKASYEFLKKYLKKVKRR
ncbi:MAG: methylaspartate mutase accessory protein GlmL [Tissierellia bacterium]|nr:methylaspartate mutase accessory protein GlmL [Tissierellia bacterium]